MEQLVFGPVPSRRLGNSIGINNIPHKVCSYSCAYCQVGKAIKMQVERQEFYHPDKIILQFENKIKLLDIMNWPDYITIVPDGEPTLDIHLGELITKLKRFDLPVAVITNSSLLPNKDVQSELMLADFVSVKVDTTNTYLWKRINKPYKDLNLDLILNAILNFSHSFRGILVSETMLIKGLNDSENEIENIARFLQKIKPDVAYLAIPTRPPAFEGTKPVEESAITLAYEIFIRRKLFTELLTGYEGNAFASSGNFEEDILSITAVHPMRKDAVQELMAKSNETEENLQKLIDNNLLKKVIYNNQEYFLRSFKKV